NHDIGPSIAVVVEHRDTKRFRTRIKDAAFRSDIFESAVALVAEEPAGGSTVRLRCAIRLLLAVGAAEYVVVGSPIHIVANEQVEMPIAVEVEPKRGRTEGASAGQSR